MIIEAVDTLRDLVRIPSVNPMGRVLDQEICYEHRLTDHLQGVVADLGLRSERHAVEPQRDNLLARIDGDVRPGLTRPLVLLEVHQDTVPTDGMTIDPWAAELREGRVYGRGACDVKGGMACMLAALSRLAHHRPRGMADVVLACTVNEEYGFSGAEHLRRLWSCGRSELLPRPPDAILVAEPTELNVVVAHKGIVRWRCHTRGRAAHSSSPNADDNAIYRMAPVLAAIRDFSQRLAAEVPAHPLVGSPTLNVGMIAGGTSVNTVPDRCTIEVERRLLPGETPQQAYDQCVRASHDQCGLQPPLLQHDPPYMASAGFSDVHNGELARGLIETAAQHGIASHPIGVPYGTDAAELATDGIPTVVFGPGSLEQAHTADEWIAVDQLEKATLVLFDFLRDAGATIMPSGTFRRRPE